MKESAIQISWNLGKFIGRVAIFAGLVTGYLYVLNNFIGSLPDHDARFLKINEILKDVQLTLLAMVVALAAYTGNVEQKLRDKMSGMPSAEKAPHLRDLSWLMTADVWLVTTGVLVILRLGAWTIRPEDHSLDMCLAWWGHVIIGGIAISILYFGVLHFIQWIKPRNTKSNGKTSEICTMEGTVTVLDALVDYAATHEMTIKEEALKQFRAIVDAASKEGVVAGTAAEIFGVAGKFFVKQQAVIQSAKDSGTTTSPGGKRPA